MNPSEELRRRNLVSAIRWRWIFIALAVVVPLGLGALFNRQTGRLRALADHGQPALATVTSITERGGITYAEYRYEVDGMAYEWSVTQRDAPYAPGQRFAITYLPEDPALSRPGPTYSPERLGAEVDLAFQHRLLFGLVVLFALAAVGCERTVRRLRAGGGAGPGVTISPETMGRAVAALLLLVLLATNLAPDVKAVQIRAFGPAPLGLPVTLVVSLAELVLFLPLFPVFLHLMRIVIDAQTRGGSFSKLGVLLAIWRAGPALHRSRVIVLVGGAYFAALMAAWIGFAASRGL